VNRPPVENAQPSRKVLRAVNPLIIALLRSPLHRVLSKKFMLLTVTGRKTGRTYTVPVGRREAPDGTLVLSAGGNWRHNLHGGADVRLTLEGRERAAHVILEEDRDRAAEVVKTLIERDGPRAIGMKVTVDRLPTAAEIRPLLADRTVAYVHLTD
jgi:deazaflavin-dependent oxidoreductase (nitroreductase family)